MEGERGSKRNAGRRGFKRAGGQREEEVQRETGMGLLWRKLCRARRGESCKELKGRCRWSLQRGCRRGQGALRARVLWTRSGLDRYKPTARGLPRLQPSTRPRSTPGDRGPSPEAGPRTHFLAPPTPLLKSPRAVIALKATASENWPSESAARGGPLAAVGAARPQLVVLRVGSR